MPSPNTSLSSLRPDLGGSLTEFDLAMDAAGYIGTRVCPVIETAVQAGTFGKIAVKDILQHPETRRAPGDRYNREQWTFEQDSFATEEHGIEEPVDRREARMYANYFDAEMVAALRARDRVMRAYEIRAAALIFNTAVWTPTSITEEWDDASNAVPITDVEARVKSIWEATGLWANALIINRRVFRNLRNCDQILDKIKYVRGTLPAEIGIAELQAAFDLPYILVGGSAKNASNSEQTVDIDPIWSDEYAAVARICTSNDIREPGVARTFHWGEDGSTIGATVESYYEEQSRSDIVRARMDTQEKVLYTAALELLDNVTT
jgi:hypothetical protein